MARAAPAGLVLGGGIAGLAAAVALRRAGYAVSLVEQAPAIAPLGAALSIWANGMAALDWLGAAEAIRREAAPIASLGVMTPGGRWLIGPSPVFGDGLGQPAAFLPSRALLQRSLTAALGDVRVDVGIEVTAVSQDSDGATVSFADGPRRSADLVIDARGIWSVDAARITGTRTRHAGYGGVLALSDPVAGSSDGSATEYWGARERFGLFELGDGRRYWFFLRDGQPDDAAPSIEHIAERARLWPGALAEAVAATPADRLIAVSIHARTLPRRLGEGRVLCVGDAAHAMEPNLGQGACQGLEDALALGRLAMTVSPARIVPGFERLRLARIRRLMREAAIPSRAVHANAATRQATRTALALVPGPLNRWAIGRQQRLPAALAAPLSD